MNEFMIKLQTLVLSAIGSILGDRYTFGHPVGRPVFPYVCIFDGTSGPPDYSTGLIQVETKSIQFNVYAHDDVTMDDLLDKIERVLCGHPNVGRLYGSTFKHLSTRRGSRQGYEEEVDDIDAQSVWHGVMQIDFELQRNF